MLDTKSPKIKLAFAFGETIHQFTTRIPMTIEDIVESLCFTAGHALAQKAALRFSTKKRLREICIAALDRGIDEGSRDRSAPQLLRPGQN